MKRAGFVINSRIPNWASLWKGMPPHALISGWDDSASPMSFMRFRWIAESLQASHAEWHYEIYRSWRTYDVVVFLKSMGPHCITLAQRLRQKGTCVIFEANVDYYTQFKNEVPLDAMAPTSQQRSDAIAITQYANGVIASSRHLAEICQKFNRRSAWIPDNVNLKLRPNMVQTKPILHGRLQVWWSGMAAKLFEFIAVEKFFLSFVDHIHLHMVTDDVEKARLHWPLSIRQRLEQLLARIPHTIHRFRGISHLLSLYSEGGIIISPRFLDTPYNLSHTEWKISLGMSCELPAIASPVPSYIDVAAKSIPGAVTICHTEEEWKNAFDRMLGNPSILREAGARAFETIQQHYETGIVAQQHAAWLTKVCACAEP